MTNACLVPPELAIWLRAAVPDATSPGAKTPMVNVLMLGLPARPWAAILAMVGMSFGLHSSGMPSVARTATTECPGFATANAFASMIAPCKAAAVGVLPLGARAASDAVRAGAAPGKSAIGTAGVA